MMVGVIGDVRSEKRRWKMDEVDGESERALQESWRVSLGMSATTRENQTPNASTAKISSRRPSHPSVLARALHKK